MSEWSGRRGFPRSHQTRDSVASGRGLWASHLKHPSPTQRLESDQLCHLPAQRPGASDLNLTLMKLFIRKWDDTDTVLMGCFGIKWRKAWTPRSPLLSTTSGLTAAGQRPSAGRSGVLVEGDASFPLELGAEPAVRWMESSPAGCLQVP